jgi:hypothetical protein
MQDIQNLLITGLQTGLQQLASENLLRLCFYTQNVIILIGNIPKKDNYRPAQHK